MQFVGSILLSVMFSSQGVVLYPVLLFSILCGGRIYQIISMDFQVARAELLDLQEFDKIIQDQTSESHSV